MPAEQVVQNKGLPGKTYPGGEGISLRFGTQIQPDGQVRFNLYAPALEQVQLKLIGSSPLSLTKGADGWHTLTTAEATPGSRYRYALPDGSEVPDPASRFQPEDCEGPSEVIDPAGYAWKDQGWKGRPWNEAVLYELHLGTFTEQGTLPAATERMDHLAELGITAIELMCVGDFPGLFNWGYDGVLIYAPDSSYGRPDDLRAFVDAAHARGLMVILDVVYNHFGPEGNTLTKTMPQLFSPEHCNAWGQALNFDAEGSHEVREYIIENALYWTREFHMDGLRLDAAHAMVDTSEYHILDELADRVRAANPGRELHLIMETEFLSTARLARTPEGRARRYTAQWNHDMSHLLGAALGADCNPNDEGAGETRRLGIALAEGYVIAAEEQGEDTDPCHIPPVAFTAAMQNHDLIGNRIKGERVYAIASPEAVRAASALHLLIPQIPMLFMGDEWAATSPFPYFCDFHGELAEAVRKGRCESLKEMHHASDEELREAPDPQSPDTFHSARLHWDELEHEPHATQFDRYRKLLALRQQEIVPLLRSLDHTCGTFWRVGPGALVVTWSFQNAILTLHANMCWNQAGGFPFAPGRELWREGWFNERGELGPWSVRWTLEN